MKAWNCDAEDVIRHRESNAKFMKRGLQSKNNKLAAKHQNLMTDELEECLKCDARLRRGVCREMRHKSEKRFQWRTHTECKEVDHV